MIWCPTPKVVSCLKKVKVSSLEELAREVARVQGQPAGKEEGTKSGDERRPLPVPKSALMVSGRLHHRFRKLTEHLVCRDEKSVKLHRER